jgi:hypothetical protein
MNRLWLAGLVLFLALSGGCSSQAPPEAPLPSPAQITRPTRTATPGAEEAPAATNAPPGSEAIEKDLPNSQYRFEVDLDLEAHLIAVDQRIEYVNKSADALSELLLVIDAIPRGADFRLEELVWGNGQGVQDYELAAGLLRIPLPSALEPGGKLGLALNYTLALPPGIGQLAYSARQSNFVDWYPFIPPYRDGQGWLVHPRAAVGEHLAFDSVNFEVEIRVQGQQQVQIAAPAPAEPIDGGWTYRLDNARRFAWSASRHFETVSNSVDGIPVTAYVYAEHRQAAEAVVAACARALNLYQSLFGEYPYESLAIVAGEFPDGLESDGLFFLYRGFFEGYTGGAQNYLTTLSAHEVSHNWWYGQVGNDPAMEPWLDEALAIYSELLYYEDLSPSLVEWWWQFRIMDYSPEGMVNTSIYDHDGFAPYVHAVYMRGAFFLQDLRVAMGDQAFFEFLRAYADAGKGQNRTAADFFGLLSQTGDYELEPLLDEYFIP